MQKCCISLVPVFIPLSCVLRMRYNETVMWPFKHKKTRRESLYSGPPCSHCGSTKTKLIFYHGTDYPDYVRVWRGQRSLTYRCFDCGRDFYGEEPQTEIIDQITEDDQVIDDEEALREAEQEIARQIEEDDDRRYGKH